MRRALGMVLVMAVAVGATLVVITRSNTPTVDVLPVVVALPTSTTEAPTTTLPPAPPPAPAAAPRAAVPRAPAAPAAPATPALTGPFWVAAAIHDHIMVWTSPDATAVQERLPGINEARTTTVLLVKQRIGTDWIEAYMPTRPNQHTGYVRTSDVTLGTVDTQIKVEIGLRRLTAWAGDRMIAQERIAVGKPSTPTPRGVYYLAMLFRTPNPAGAYGPYVFGLSSHSEVYEQFGGGDGLVGLHGTNQPSSIGQAASNGCIRLPNAAISRLVSILPVGTPIVVV